MAKLEREEHLTLQVLALKAQAAKRDFDDYGVQLARKYGLESGMRVTDDGTILPDAPPVLQSVPQAE